jgi:outer membrane protein OmpA-like peptidoglycan-associated protein
MVNTRSTPTRQTSPAARKTRSAVAQRPSAHAGGAPADLQRRLGNRGVSLALRQRAAGAALPEIDPAEASEISAEASVTEAEAGEATHLGPQRPPEAVSVSVFSAGGGGGPVVNGQTALANTEQPSTAVRASSHAAIATQGDASATTSEPAGQVVVDYRRQLDVSKPTASPVAQPEVAPTAAAAAEAEPTASRPAEPGQGEGIDVAFVLTPYTTDTEKQQNYIYMVKTYLMTVAPDADLIWVDDLADIVKTLGDFAKTEQRIRRIRIVAHGTKKGKVLIHIPEKKKSSELGRAYWAPPTYVENFAKSSEVRELMDRVLTPDAVVEFWGCHLGAHERAGQAWANLFGRTFIAPRGYFIYYSEKIFVRVRHHDPKVRRIDRKIGEKIGDRHPGGPWVYRQVTKTSDLAGWGTMATEDFKAELEKVYVRLRGGGLVPDYGTEWFEKMSLLFDLHGRSPDPGVISVGPERKPDDNEPPIAPDEPEWKTSFRPFEPTLKPEPGPSGPPKEQVRPEPAEQVTPVPSAPTETREPLRPAPAVPLPPPPAVEPARPPAVEPAPPAAVEPAPPAAVEPAPPAAVEPTPPAAVEPARPPAPAKVPPEVTPVPPTPKPAPTPEPVPLARRPVPPAPPAVSPETEWARRHPDGRVTKVGRDEWLIWNFGVGSPTVKPEHSRAFEEIAAALAEAPGGLVIEGLASASGSVSRNEQLSLVRARSVADMLPVFGIYPTQLTIRPLGGRPLRTGPEDASRDRAVSIRIPPRSRRKPLLPPEDAIDWLTTEPSPPREQLPEVPQIGFAFKHKLMKWKGKKILPLGVDWYLVGEVELGYQLELDPKAPAAVAASFDKGKWDGEIKIALSNSVELKGSLLDPSISVTFKNVPLKPEVKLGLAQLLENPGKLGEMLREDPLSMLKIATVRFTIPTPETKDVDLGIFVPALSGVYARAKTNLKVAVSIAPSPILMARLGAAIASRLSAVGGAAGAAAVPVAAGIVGGAAWTVLALYLINLAHRRGETWAHVVDLRRGYAYRLAAEAADWKAGELRGSGSTVAWDQARRTVGTALPAGPGQLTEEQKQPFKMTYTSLYDGWEAAGEAINGLRVAEYDQIMQRLRQLAGPSFKDLTELIFGRLGGDSREDTPLDIEWLRTK